MIIYSITNFSSSQGDGDLTIFHDNWKKKQENSTYTENNNMYRDTQNTQNRTPTNTIHNNGRREVRVLLSNEQK